VTDCSVPRAAALLVPRVWPAEFVAAVGTATSCPGGRAVPAARRINPGSARMMCLPPGSAMSGLTDLLLPGPNAEVVHARFGVWIGMVRSAPSGGGGPLSAL